jgi:hypothetical protein
MKTRNDALGTFLELKQVATMMKLKSRILNQTILTLEFNVLLDTSNADRLQIVFPLVLGAMEYLTAEPMISPTNRTNRNALVDII